MLVVEKLSKRYSNERVVDAVKEIDLALEKGRFLAVVGRSGSGKSTLLAMLGGISRPSSGSLKIGGVDQWCLDENAHADFRNRKIGYVFQFASLLSNLRAVDNVALPALIGGWLSRQEAYLRARILLDRVGLADKIESYPGELSGGEQRRVAIARALINSPEILLADEPTADLDEETEEEILNLIVDIHRAFELTLVVVTHNPAIAERADVVLRMQAGGAELEECGGERPERTPCVSTIPDIYNAPSDVIRHQKIELGMGIERLIGRLVMLVVPLLLLTFCVHAAITFCQRSIIEKAESEQRQLEELAMSGLRADVKDVVFSGRGDYIVSIQLTNTLGEKPIYLMAPAVRGFVQVGSLWQEVPMEPAVSPASRVLKVTGTQIHKYVLKPDVKDFAKLIPCYMHVRIANDMLISDSSQPRKNLIERNDNYYVYLKPHDAKDKEILKSLKFPGAPPIWIPMPPH